MSRQPTYTEMCDHYHSLYDSGEIGEAYLKVLLGDLKKRFGDGNAGYQPSTREVLKLEGKS